MAERVVVVGLGYVGLPVLIEAAEAGHSVTGFDVSVSVVEQLNVGRSHVDDISDLTLARCLELGARFSADPAVFDDATVIVICVPTPLGDDQTPDLSAVRSASATVSDHLAPGALVVLESTTYPGTTDGVVKDILEAQGRRVAGDDFALAFSPERIDPGNSFYTLRNTPKVVGGFTPACGQRAVDFYSTLVDEVVPVSGPREAEMSKLLENTYRHVNIALVNEMAIFSNELGIDLWESIRAASTKPFGFSPFFPGPGVGGHCIPIDPNYLSYTVRTLGYQFRFVELAQEVSNRMPAYVVARVQEQLNQAKLAVNGAHVLVLGVTYKPNIGDDRETPARPVIRHLRRLGADVTYHDPHIEEFSVDGESVPRVEAIQKGLGDCDVALLLQMHSEYSASQIVQLAPRVFDTRGVLEGDNVERL